MLVANIVYLVVNDIEEGVSFGGTLLHKKSHVNVGYVDEVVTDNENVKVELTFW